MEHLGLKGCSELHSPNLNSANLKSLDLSLCGKLVSAAVLPTSCREEGKGEEGGREGRRGRRGAGAGAGGGEKE